MSEEKIVGSESVWDSEVVSKLEDESSGGGNWVAYTNVQFGYKVFAPGFDNNQTFFPFNIGDENSKKSARLEASSFVDKLNKDNTATPVKAPTNAIRIELDKDQVYNKDTSTWQGNYIQDTPLWVDAYKTLIKENLKKAGAGLGWQWAHLAWGEDPYKPTRINKLTGEEVANLVLYVKEVYLTKQEALDAAAKLAAGGGGNRSTATADDGAVNSAEATKDDSVPPGFEDVWDEVKSAIVKELAEGATVPQIATDYGIAVKYIVKLKK